MMRITATPNLFRVCKRPRPKQFRVNARDRRQGPEAPGGGQERSRGTARPRSFTNPEKVIRCCGARNRRGTSGVLLREWSGGDNDGDDVGTKLEIGYRSCDHYSLFGPDIDKGAAMHPTIVNDLGLLFTTITSESPEGWKAVTNALQGLRQDLDKLKLANFQPK
ncbi:hypothetical protein QJQ45_023402, partial [Haematococcus lacustris]